MSLDKCDKLSGDAASTTTATITSEDHEKPKLTNAQLARIERNRQKALLLRQSRLANQRISDPKMTVGCKRVVDSGGGFLIEEDSNEAPKKLKIVEEAPPALYDDDEVYICDECEKPFVESYLLTHFNYATCDECRDNEGKHSLITKTEAKTSYLLSDVDLFVREPPLKFIVRKNPRNTFWGDMKLFLRLQVEKRALEVWETPEKLEDEKMDREEKREIAKRKKFKKNMTKLRQEVRSSLYTAKNKAHVHEYGEDVQVDEDTWKKTCTGCEHTITFEKM